MDAMMDDIMEEGEEEAGLERRLEENDDMMRDEHMDEQMGRDADQMAMMDEMDECLGHPLDTLCTEGMLDCATTCSPMIGEMLEFECEMYDPELDYGMLETAGICLDALAEAVDAPDELMEAILIEYLEDTDPAMIDEMWLEPEPAVDDIVDGVVDDIVDDIVEDVVEEEAEEESRRRLANGKTMNNRVTRKYVQLGTDTVFPFPAIEHPVSNVSIVVTCRIEREHLAF